MRAVALAGLVLSVLFASPRFARADDEPPAPDSAPEPAAPAPAPGGPPPSDEDASAPPEPTGTPESALGSEPAPSPEPAQDAALPPGPAAPVVNVVAEQPPPAPSDARGDAFALRVGAGALLGTGTALGASAGGLVLVGLRRRALSLDLEGRADARSGVEVRDGRVDTALRVGQLAFCWHKSAAVLCALGGAGVVQAVGDDVGIPFDRSSLYAHAGGRFALEIPVVGPLALRVSFDAVFPFTRTTVRIGGEPAWSVQPAALAVGAGLVLEQ